MVTEKECTKCHEVKSASAFSRDPRTSSGLYSRCKACHSGGVKHAHHTPAYLRNIDARLEGAGRCARCHLLLPCVCLPDAQGYAYSGTSNLGGA